MSTPYKLVLCGGTAAAGAEREGRSCGVHKAAMSLNPLNLFACTVARSRRAATTPAYTASMMEEQVETMEEVVENSVADAEAPEPAESASASAVDPESPSAADPEADADDDSAGGGCADHTPEPAAAAAGTSGPSEPPPADWLWPFEGQKIEVEIEDEESLAFGSS